jgi:RND family efflux transporter MFP subunit
MKTSNFLIIICSLISLVSCGRPKFETKPIKQDISETVFGSGTLEAENSYNLSAEANGYLKKADFKEGDLISQGQVLAVVENRETEINQVGSGRLLEIAKENTTNRSPSLQQAQNSVTLTKAKLEQDTLLYKRYKDLWTSNSVAKVDFENAELQYTTSKENYENALENLKLAKQQVNQELINKQTNNEIDLVKRSKNQIRALAAGKVYKKYKEAGDLVRNGDSIALIGNPQSIYAKINIDESSIDKIHLGQEALIQLNTNKSKSYKAKIIEIAPSYDQDSQSYQCKLEFIDPLEFKILGTQLQSNIIISKNPNAILIPRNFLNLDGTVQIKGHKTRTKIKTKFIGKDWVQVLEGLTLQSVITSDKKDSKPSSSQDEAMSVI